MRRNGIANDTFVVFYGDKNNWWACYALWIFELFGHTRIAVMDGGRLKWEQEGRPMTREVPIVPQTEYRKQDRADYKIRPSVMTCWPTSLANRPLVDVRSPGEYTGQLYHMEGYPQEGALRRPHQGRGQRRGPAHNPTDGSFKTADQLRHLRGRAGPEAGDDVIAYCRIGERSSHTWFVLKYLLGYPNVRNSDGSWTEWGNLVGVPIER